MGIYFRQSIWMVASFLVLSFGENNAQAWDIHRTLMEPILSGAPPSLQEALNRRTEINCVGESSFLQQTTSQLQMNTEVSLPALVDALYCNGGYSMSLGEVLAYSSVDDPDLGLDRNLPPELDPKGERAWMGGVQGPSSQGFRHMYFGGWNLLQPISTFQIPFRAIGKAPERAEIIARSAQQIILEGNPLWGARVIGWALHYIQDLAQPFHAVQTVSLKLIPWGELLQWPPSKAFSTFVAESTRTISNYHWGYEGYVRTQLLKGPDSPLYECLKNPTQFTKIEFSSNATPRDIALTVAKASTVLAPKLGNALLEFYGPELLTKNYNLSAGKGDINYEAYTIRPDLTSQRQKLNKVTCEALANASLGSWHLLARILMPTGSSQ